MPGLRDYKVFISHAWDYNDEYYRLERMLNEAPCFIWTNLSVPKHDPIKNTRELEYELNGQMRPANVFLILAGMYAARREWLEYEINFARRIGRPIIGVVPWGQERVPEIVQNAAKEMVGWNTSNIVRAIREWALPEGQ
jgi:hypothetical protein